MTQQLIRSIRCANGRFDNDNSLVSCVVNSHDAHSPIYDHIICLAMGREYACDTDDDWNKGSLSHAPNERG